MTRPRAKIIGIIAGVAALAVALLLFYGSDRQRLSQREVAMRVLGEYLRKEANAHSVVVAGNSYTLVAGHRAEIYSFEKSSEAGLRKGLGADVEVAVDFPKLKPEALTNPSAIYVDPNTTTPLSYLIVEGAFDELLRAHPKADVIVSLVGLPADLFQEECWIKGNARLALLLPDFRILGDFETARIAFKSGKIIAAVINRPGAAGADKNVGGGYKAEFEKRFLLVTKENVDSLLPVLIH